MSDQRWWAVKDRYELLPALAEVSPLLAFSSSGRANSHPSASGKPSLLVLLLLRISALLFLFAPCLLIFSASAWRSSCSSSSYKIQKPWRKSCPPAVVARFVYPKRMCRNTCHSPQSSAKAGSSAPTPASSQMSTWWLPQSRALTNTFLSRSSMLMSCANNLRFGDAPFMSRSIQRGTFGGLTLELATDFDRVHIELTGASAAQPMSQISPDRY